MSEIILIVSPPPPAPILEVDQGRGPQGGTGLTGDAGPEGPQGDPGADSTVPGPQGLIGNTGPNGPQGDPGVDGTDGATGPQGVKGDTGNDGADGATGPAGSDGAAGPAGADGATGPQGPQGVAGTAGSAGTSGSKWYTGSGVPSNATGLDTDYYLRSNGDYYGPKTAGSWGSVAGSLLGPTGATGAAGAAGSTGPAGATGSTGPAGPAGNAGATGPAGPSTLVESTAPASPSAGSQTLFIDSADHILKRKTSAGVINAIENGTYKGAWAAGTYLAGSVVTKDGAHFGTPTLTTDTPAIPISNYSPSLATVPSGSYWSYVLSSGQAVNVVSGSSLSGSAVSGTVPTNAMRLQGGAASTTGYMELTLNFPTGGTIAFSDCKNSEIWEQAAFSIDGVDQYSSYGNTFNWTARSYSVAAGSHTFRWSFGHDSGGTQGADSYGIGNLVTTGSVISSGSWEILGYLADGASGPTGPAGPTGPTGAAGSAGATGSTGPAGATGPGGPSTLVESATPSSPAAGSQTLFVGTDHRLKRVDSLGIVKTLTDDAGSVSIRAVQHTSSYSGTVSFTVPGSAVVGDTLIAFFAGAYPASSATPPTGWVYIDPRGATTAGTYVSQGFLTKICVASDIGATVNISLDGTYGWSSECIAINGSNITIAHAVNTNGTGSSTGVSAGSLATAIGDFVITFGYSRNGSGGLTSSFGVVSDSYDATPSGVGTHIAVFAGLATGTSTAIGIGVASADGTAVAGIALRYSSLPPSSTTLLESATPASPVSGSQTLFIASSDHKLKRVSSAGVVTGIEGTTFLNPVMQKRGAWSATPKALLSIDYESGIPAAMSGNTIGYPQIVAATDVTAGTTQSMIAGPGGNSANQTASITVLWAGDTSDTLTVRYWVQSEGGYDYARLYVDGVQVASNSGNQTGFLSFAVTGISPGNRVITMAFTSDSNSGAGFQNARWGKISYWGPDASAAYMQGHVVTYGGVSYYSLVDNNSVTPGTDSTKWLSFLEGAISGTVGPGCRIYRSAALNVASVTGSQAKFPYDSVDYDSTGTMWSAGSPDQITIPTSGRYHIHAAQSWSGADQAYSYHQIRVNGISVIDRFMPGWYTADYASMGVEGDFNLTAGDIVTYWYEQRTGSSRPVIAGKTQTFMTVTAYMGTTGATGPAGPPGLGTSPPQAQSFLYTGGNISTAQTNGGTASATAWALLDSTIKIVFTGCIVGDVLNVMTSFSEAVATGATSLYDFVIWKNGSLVRALGGASIYGDQGLTVHYSDGNVNTKRASSALFVVAAGDIHTDGTVTIALGYQQVGGATPRVVDGTVDTPIRLQGVKLSTSGVEAWTIPTFQNSWVNYASGGFSDAAYRKDSNGLVHLRGLVKNGTKGSPIFTLPVGYRPTSSQIFMVVAAAASGSGSVNIGRVDVAATGAVTPVDVTGGGTYDGVSYWGLDGITFYID